jgi:hypothetical protein
VQPEAAPAVQPEPTPAVRPEAAPAAEVQPEPARNAKPTSVSATPRPVVRSPAPAPTAKPANPPAPEEPLPAEPPVAEASDEGTLVVQAAKAVAKGAPGEALAILEQRSRRFGDSELSGPAGLVEHEALRQLGRFEEALAKLETLARRGQLPTGKRAELPLMRAELLMAMHRCREAIPLLEQVVGDPKFTARAQAGLAACSNSQ